MTLDAGGALARLTCLVGKQSLQYAYTATVAIMTATSAMPQPMTRAPTLRCFWKDAPNTRKPQMYNGTAM